MQQHGKRSRLQRTGIIQKCVWAVIEAGKPVKGNVLGKSGKAGAIDTIWRDRDALFAAFLAANDKVEFGLSLPWIGNITKWHLAKNMGVDCAKPDVHLERVASHYGTTPAALCADLALATGDRIATVDLAVMNLPGGPLTNLQDRQNTAFAGARTVKYISSFMRIVWLAR